MLVCLNVSLEDFLEHGEDFRTTICEEIKQRSSYSARMMAHAICVGGLGGGTSCDICIGSDEALRDLKGAIDHLQGCDELDRSHCAPVFAKAQRDFIKQMHRQYAPHCKSAMILAKGWVQRNLPPKYRLRSCATELLVVLACQRLERRKETLPLEVLLEEFLRILRELRESRRHYYVDQDNWKQTPEEVKYGLVVVVYI